MDIKINSKTLDKSIDLVEVEGEIDVYTSGKLKEFMTKLIQEGKYNFIISLESIRYIDSTGLGVLIGILKRVREHNGSIRIVCSNPQIKKIFNITALSKIFGIYDSVEEAKDNFF